MNRNPQEPKPEDLITEIKKILPADYDVHPLTNHFCFYRGGRNGQVIVRFRPKLQLTPYDYMQEALNTFQQIG